MTPYGISLLMVLATGFVGWTVSFGAMGRTVARRGLPTGLAIALILLDTVLYAYLLVSFAEAGRPAFMHGLQVIMFQVTAISLGAIIWAIIGQRALYGFLNAPLIFLLLALGLRLAALALGLTFDPTT